MDQTAIALCRENDLPVIVFDMSARVDSQSHADYARRMFDWSLREHPQRAFDAARYFDDDHAGGDYLHVFDQQGRRVTQSELGFDELIVCESFLE